jgi:hypothetical protein
LSHILPRLICRVIDAVSGRGNQVSPRVSEIITQRAKRGRQYFDEEIERALLLGEQGK